MRHLMPRPLPWTVRLGILLPLLVMAALPLLVYFDSTEYEQTLLLMLLTLVIVQFMLSMRTASLAADMMHRLRNLGGNWDLLVLTGLEARSLPWHVCLTVLRLTWIDHAMLALPRLGVALAFAQYYHIVSVPVLSQSPVSFNTRVFLYVSHNYINVTPPHLLFRNHDLSQVGIALVILLIYAVIEAALAAGLGILWGVLIKRHNIALGAFMLSRAAIAGAAMLLLILLGQIYPLVGGQFSSVWHSGGIRSRLFECLVVERGQAEEYPYRYQRGQALHQTGKCDDLRRELTMIRGIEAVQVTMLSFIEQGILLGANTMRITSHLPPWPFVLRNVLSATLAMALYTMMIATALRIVHMKLLRRGLH